MTGPRYEHPVGGLAADKLGERMRAAIDAARRELPPGVGVTLFAFDFGGGGGLAYISNAQRDDMVIAVREWLATQGQGRRTKPRRG